MDLKLQLSKALLLLSVTCGISAKNFPNALNEVASAGAQAWPSS